MRTTKLAELYQSEGPFASVTIDVGHDSENADHQHELRVRAAREELIEAGADETVVEIVAERLAESVHEAAPVARSVVATAEGVIFDQVIHARVDMPVVDWGPLPDVTPWLEHQDAATPFVLAVVDHVGGDVAAYSSAVPEPADVASVGGETHHAHKVPTGGWSALRYQHVVENVWKENAEAVAEEIIHHVRRGYRLVLLAGDPQSRPTVLAALASSDAEVVELDTGTRADDGGDEALQQAIREALFEHTVARRLRLAHTLKERLGRGQSAATGVADVADAFVRGQVETLLLDPSAAAHVTVDPGRHPGLVLGAAAPDEPVPAHQALVAAAALTGAEVAIARAGTLGGAPAAGLLRWDQTAEGTTA